MALPTLRPSLYVGNQRGKQAERLYVQRRNREADLKEKWTEASRYYRMSDVRSSKQKDWTSSHSFMDSMTAYSARGKKEEKKRKLEERKKKLASLLEQERDAYEQELSDSSSGKLLHMKDRAEQLKTRRIEQDRKVAEEKMKEYVKANCLELREVESRQMQRAVQEEWKGQIERRRSEIDSARREERRYNLAMEEERLAALKLEEDLKAKKEMMEQHYVETLKQQMAEVRAREEEAARLEEEQASLIQEQMKLERAEDERKELEEAQKKAYMGRILLRQHKAQLRRKSRQIQDALELDLKILEDLSLKEQEDLSAQSARREKAKADVQWMKQVVSEQMKLEKRREKELDLLYQEEATRMWQKREEEWEREKLARERLMKEVLADRQKQIEARMEAIQEQQAESIQRREELLHDIELSNQMTARENHIREREKENRIKELAQQVSEKKRLAQKDLEIDVLKLEEQRQMDEDYDDYLKEEIQLNTESYQPKFYGRKKHAWY